MRAVRTTDDLVGIALHSDLFATRTEARLRIATWITGFYNTHRLHSVCGYQSPIDYEHDHRANSALELAA
ncbi:hypothetical protein [Streptomyces sp. NBC_01451]|uniref:hypothetical protein n=1 Tax=Streptomyces sp. NBC_01451 TaxID=2903872 RepID=UPI002E354681|nr:hypothetical protein [Streptomyces sp. NBC_01451]